jgi:hypothetical protein
VIKIPLHVPHALQHGVRVVEFQTPAYERKIISFGQKVLTQKGWDVERALQLMQLDVPDDAIVPARNQDGLIAEFEDFAVYTKTLSSRINLRAFALGEHYVIGMGIGGDLISGLQTGGTSQLHRAGEAFWVPPCAAHNIYFEPRAGSLRILIATPRV